jgi:hypothetical protein
LGGALIVALRVGIARRIKLEWLDAAAWKAATETDAAEIRKYLDELLRPECRGKEARRKTITALTRIWITVPQEHRSLQQRALRMLVEGSSDTRIWLHWGMTLLAYPFFRDIADIIGRLLALQDEVSLQQIYRRLTEKWGERSYLYRVARHVVRSMVDWDVLQDTSVRGVYVPTQRLETSSAEVQLLLLEALLLAEATPAVILQQLPQLPTAFPFDMNISAAHIRRSERFDVQRQGLDLDLVTIADP